MDEQNAQTNEVFAAVSPEEEEEEEDQESLRSYSTRARHLRRGVYALDHTLCSIHAIFLTTAFFFTHYPQIHSTEACFVTAVPHI